MPDVQRAFGAYERLRRDRVQRVVRYSAKLGKSKLPGPIGRFFRDLMMPFALKHFASPKAHAWLFTHHIHWDTNIA